MPVAEKTIGDYYFEFDEQDYTTILVVAFVTSRKPDAKTEPTAHEKERIQILENMFHNLSELPRYVVYFGGPGPVRAQGTDFLATAIRGAISRKDRSRPTLEEVIDLIGNNLKPSSKKVKSELKEKQKQT